MSAQSPSTLADAHLFFHYCEGIGPKRFRLVVQAFGDALLACTAPKDQWFSLGFPPKIIEAVFLSKARFDLKNVKEQLARFEIQYLPQCDPTFPSMLQEIPDCPIGLFIKGSFVPTDTKALAVVGTRKVTPYGREVTERFVSQLVSRGFTIVSGLARGVDGIAHKAALAAGGRTIAVLGCGLDEVYPPEHKQLASEVIQRGVIVSEFVPHTKLMPGNFPARNRIVSGLSLGVLVTEGSSQSGTNITAMMAVDQNREVFAIPGPITSQMSQGPAKLIQMGAKLVLSVEDILSEIHIASVDINTTVNAAPNGHQMITKPEFDDKTQEQVWQLLVNGQRHVDELGRELKLSLPLLTTSLTLLELKGMIKHLGDGVWMAA